MPRNLRPVTRERLHPRNTLTPPTMPVRRQATLFQVLPIHRPQHRIEDIRKPLHHRENRIRQVSATVPAERPRAFRRAAETRQRRTLRRWSRLLGRWGWVEGPGAGRRSSFLQGRRSMLGGWSPWRCGSRCSGRWLPWEGGLGCPESRMGCGGGRRAVGFRCGSGLLGNCNHRG